MRTSNLFNTIPTDEDNQRNLIPDKLTETNLLASVILNLINAFITVIILRVL